MCFPQTLTAILFHFPSPGLVRGPRSPQGGCRPVELPDGAQAADVAAAAGQDGQVVGVQGEEETFRGELRLRKQRLIPV